VNHIKERNGLARLIGLQRANHMQHDVIHFAAERGPLRSRLLKAAFTEMSMPVFNQRHYALGFNGLGNGYDRRG